MATNHDTHTHYDVPECEIVFEDGGSKSNTRDNLKQLYDNCDKNRGHPNFIPVTEFGLNNLPKELRTEKFLNFIQRRCEITVRIAVRYTSQNRPNYSSGKQEDDKNSVRFGTGAVLPFTKSECKIRGKCPCPLCKSSDNPKVKYWELVVKTATHVICDDSEAECSQFDCFLDTDSTRCKRLHGVRTHEKNRTPCSRIDTDACYCVCVTHEEDTVNRLHNVFGMTLGSLFHLSWMNYPPHEVMVSHPHGCSKRVTVGKFLHLTAPVEQHEKGKLLKFFPDTICRLPLKPWAPDGIHSQSWSDEDKLKPFFESMFKKLHENDRKRVEGQTYYTWYTKTTPGNPESVTDKIYHVLIGSVYDVYKYALITDLVDQILQNAQSMCTFVTWVIFKRYRNVTFSQTKTFEFLDIGLMLLRCYLILVIDVLTNVFHKKATSFDVRLILLQTFMEMMFSFHPEIQLLFDIHKYVTEKSEQYMIQDYEYLDKRDVKKAFVKIMIADDVDKLGGESRCNENDDDDGDDDVFEDLTDFELHVFHFFFDLYHNCFSLHSKKPKYLEKLRNLSVGECLQPGTEFKLPSYNTYFILPSDAKCTFRYYRGEPGSFVFPTGTRFFLVSHEDKQYIDLPIPCESEFICDFFIKRNLYVSHDINSCPGSSGASMCSKDIRETLFIHSGVDHDKVNSSGAWQINRNYRTFEQVDSKISYQIPSIALSEYDFIELKPQAS